jgi:hypothetical protein
MIPVRYSEARGTLIYEKNLKSKISCQTPFKEPKNRFQGTNSARLCSLAGRYDNPLPTQFLAPTDCLKIPAQYSSGLFSSKTDKSRVTNFSGDIYMSVDSGNGCITKRIWLLQAFPSSENQTLLIIQHITKTLHVLLLKSFIVEQLLRIQDNYTYDPFLELCKHGFVIQPLQNPPLCGSTIFPN